MMSVIEKLEEKPSRQESLGRAFELYQRDALRFCVFKMRGMGFEKSQIERDAEDIVAEVWMSYMVAGKTLDITRRPEEIRSYLFEMVRFKIFDHRRKQRIPSEKLVSLLPTGAQIEEDMDSGAVTLYDQVSVPPLDLLDLENNILVSKILECLASGDARAARLIHLRYWEGMRDGEVAEQFGVRRDTVTRWIAHALRTCRTAMPTWVR